MNTLVPFLLFFCLMSFFPFLIVGDEKFCYKNRCAKNCGSFLWFTNWCYTKKGSNNEYGQCTTGNLQNCTTSCLGPCDPFDWIPGYLPSKRNRLEETAEDQKSPFLCRNGKCAKICGGAAGWDWTCYTNENGGGSEETVPCAKGCGQWECSKINYWIGNCSPF